MIHILHHPVDPDSYNTVVARGESPTYISLARGHNSQPVIRARSELSQHSLQRKMSFDKIFDLTAGVYFFYILSNIIWVETMASTPAAGGVAVPSRIGLFGCAFMVLLLWII